MGFLIPVVAILIPYIILATMVTFITVFTPPYCKFRRFSYYFCLQFLGDEKSWDEWMNV